MKTAIKKTIIILLVFLLCFTTTSCLFFVDDTKSYSTISKYVTDHIDILNEFPYSNLPDDFLSNEHKEKIKKILGDDTIVEYVNVKNDERIIYYHCGGSGFVGGSTDTGFYFSKQNKPYSMNYHDIEFIETSKDVFEWKDDNRYHYIKTIKIIDNWYYYYEDWY